MCALKQKSWKIGIWWSNELALSVAWIVAGFSRLFPWLCLCHTMVVSQHSGQRDFLKDVVRSCHFSAQSPPLAPISLRLRPYDGLQNSTWAHSQSLMVAHHCSHTGLAVAVTRQEFSYLGPSHSLNFSSPHVSGTDSSFPRSIYWNVAFSGMPMNMN